MTIATHSELVTELEAYLDRADYTARIPTFIKLTEVKLNRILDDPDMEVRATVTATGQYTALPVDFKRLIGVSVGGPDYSLAQTSGTAITSMDQTNTGDPRAYAIVDGSITFAPSSTNSAISILYARTIPSLTAASPTNWLLTRAPDLYLFGGLIQASILGWDDERVPGFKALFDEAVTEMRSDGANRRWGSAPLAPRLARA